MNTRDAGKTLVLKAIIDRYPQMLRLLKVATAQLEHRGNTTKGCALCQIRTLLKEIKK